jgi:hypothetical protein
MRPCLVLLYLVVNAVHGATKSDSFYTVNQGSSHSPGVYSESHEKSITRGTSYSRTKSSKSRRRESMHDESSVSLSSKAHSRSLRNSGSMQPPAAPTLEDKIKRILDSAPAQSLIQLATAAATLRAVQKIEDRIYGTSN